MFRVIGYFLAFWDKLFSLKFSILLVSWGIIFGLAMSLISQRFFGYVPCKLCLAQRFSFLVSLVSLVASYFLLKRKNHSWFILYCVGTAGLLIAFSFSLYQLLVQFDFIPEPDFCMVNTNLIEKSIEEFDEILEYAPYVAGCKLMGPTFLGLPISFFSCVFSIGGAFYMLFAMRIKKIDN